MIGTQSNKYKKIGRCKGHKDCSLMISSIRDGHNKEYICNNCQDESNDTIMSRTEWVVQNVSKYNNQVNCFCNNEGIIECEAITNIIGIRVNNLCEDCNSSYLHQHFTPKGKCNL